MFRFLVFVIAVSVVFTACEKETEIVQPNPDLTMSYTDFSDNAPAAPPIHGGWQNMSCVEFNNGIHEWASIGVPEGPGNNAVNRTIVVHASLVHIPSGQNYVIVLDPQGFNSGFTFDIAGDNLKFHRSLADAKAEGNPIHLHPCNTTPSDATHIVYEAAQFNDDRADKASLAEVSGGTATQSVHVLPIANVNTINFAGGQIISGSTANIPATVTKAGFDANTYGTPTALKDRTRVMFFSSQAAADQYAIPIRMRRTVFEGRGSWYSIGLYVKSHGEASGTIHSGDGDSSSGFERIQFISDNDFPETDQAKGTFIRDQFTSNAWRNGFDNGNTYFRFSAPFKTRGEAVAVNHTAAAAATPYTNDKLALRFSFEPDVLTAQAQRNEFGGGEFGSGFLEAQVGLYTDSMANDVVRGIAVTGTGGLTSSVTLGGVTLTREARWTYRGTDTSATQVNNLKTFFGYSATWGRTSIPSASPARTTTLPVLLVLNTTNMTLSTTDPLNLYSIPDAHEVKWYASGAAAQTAITNMEGAARIYTYFNVTQ